MKKVIALITAAFIILSFFTSFIVSAEEESDKMTKKEYQAAQSWLISQWCTGKITYSQYKEQSESVTNKFISDNSIGTVPDTILTEYENAVNTTKAIGEKIGATVQKYGDTAAGVVKAAIDVLMSDYQKTTQVSSSGVDYEGHGAVYRLYNDYHCQDVFCEYIVVLDASHVKLINCDYLKYDGEIRTRYGSGMCIEMSYPNPDPSHAKWSVAIYGDIRYSDGTEAPSDEDYTEVLDYDFTEKKDPTNPDNIVPVTEEELSELLEEINEELERLNPDLSSVESTLQAIYYRLGKLDSDDDGKKLDLINETILSVLQSDDEDAEKAIDVLLEMRDYLKNGMNGTSGDEHTIAGTLYNVKPLDKNWLNKLTTDKTELKVEYEGKTYYLESDGCLKLGDKFYHVDLNYDNYTTVDFDFSNENIEVDRSKYVDVDFNNYGKMWANLSVSQKKKINSVVDLIYKLVEQAVPYAVITSAFASFEFIIFNTAEPDDIVLKFDDFELFGNTVNGFSVTILSKDFFSNGYVEKAISIIRSLLTVIIGYCWLLSMRKKAVGMLG